jgi:hypothetical protein
MMATQRERKTISLEEKLNILWMLTDSEDLYFLGEVTWILSISSEYDSDKPYH